jgi:hypothetical protein
VQRIIDPADVATAGDAASPLLVPPLAVRFADRAAGTRKSPNLLS